MSPCSLITLPRHLHRSSSQTLAPSLDFIAAGDEALSCRDFSDDVLCNTLVFAPVFFPLRDSTPVLFLGVIGFFLALGYMKMVI